MSMTWKPASILLALLAASLLIATGVSINDITLAQQLFVHTSYYCLMLTVLCWVGVYLQAARDVSAATIITWLKDNWPGLTVALGVTLVAASSIEPALRVLSDEANLVGVSKNFWANQTATFTVSGKNYYESYFDVDVAIDQRPTLFPFLVSLVHTALGYSHSNVFVLNLLLLPAFLLVGYRLAKLSGGERFAIVVSLLLVAHPVILISVRSGGFDFLAIFFSLLILKNLHDYLAVRSPANLAILWMNLCMFAGIRYESALFIPPIVMLLLLFKMLSFGVLRPYAFIYALTPAFLLPRAWQAMLRGSVPAQEPGTVTFSIENFIDNSYEYLLPILEPKGTYPAHSAVVIALGTCGVVLWMRWLIQQVRRRAFESNEFRFALFVVSWLTLQAVIVLSYVWGRAQYPTAARLVMGLDVFFSFGSAAVLCFALRKFSSKVPVLFACAILTLQFPVAAQGRMMNRLTQTRESAATWRFFKALNDPRILIVTDRPNHFTIMNYGAMSFESARADRHLFVALDRRLFHDVYVIQQIKLSTGAPLDGYEFWSDRKLNMVHEFQNDADVLVRISRVVRR